MLLAWRDRKNSGAPAQRKEVLLFFRKCGKNIYNSEGDSLQLLCLSLERETKLATAKKQRTPCNFSVLGYPLPA